MVSKERLGGFIDAIVAVIMTIMLLEFEVPKSGKLGDFIEANLVYLIAFVLSFIYVTTSWYNQQFMLKTVSQVTRRMYVATVLWILALAMLPVLAAWTGKTMDLFVSGGIHSPKGPALLFMGMIFIWGVTYIHMSKIYAKDNPGKEADKILNMEVYFFLNHKFWYLAAAGGLIITFIYPPFVFIYTLTEMIAAIFLSKNRSAVT